MKPYFLISEFAKLRGININSLRYYEKLGILKPAHIDEKTGYRYYSPEQLPLLNQIILCIQLGIPLKEMTEYIDENGRLQSQKLLEQGRIVALQRIHELENNLKYIDFSLNDIQENEKFAEKTGTYTRFIEERSIIATDYYDGTPDVKKIVSLVSELYKSAQQNDLFPVLPAGQILNFDEQGCLHVRFFLKVLNTSKGHPMIETLPTGKYTCLRISLPSDIDLTENNFSETDFVKIIQKNWKCNINTTFIIDNIMLEKYSFMNSPSELQKLE